MSDETVEKVTNNHRKCHRKRCVAIPSSKGILDQVEDDASVRLLLPTLRRDRNDTQKRFSTASSGLIDTPYFKSDLSVLFWVLVALAKLIKYQ